MVDNDNMSDETIERAAYRVDGKVYSTPRPGRHRQALDAAIADGKCPNSGEQGFVTSTGRFVSRWSAYRLAIMAGQLITPPRTGISAECYSEDLW